MINAIIYVVAFLLLLGLLTLVQNGLVKFIGRGMNPEFRRWMVISFCLAVVQVGLIYSSIFLSGERTGYGDFSDGLATNVYYLSLAGNILLLLGLASSVITMIKEYSSSSTGVNECSGN